MGNLKGELLVEVGILLYYKMTGWKRTYAQKLQEW